MIGPVDSLVERTEITAAIVEETVRLCKVYHGESLQAVVLTGSAARDEATLITEGELRRVLGDAEFLLIFQDSAALPGTPSLKLLANGIEHELSSDRVACRISLGAVHPNYLAELRPHIFAYELRAFGRVVQGDRHILSLIPPFAASAIPLEDGWRLLCNRMTEQLDALCDVEVKGETLPLTISYATMKLYLDLATSFLLFCGSYAPTYRQRADSLCTMATTARERDGWPFPLRAFARVVRQCTDWKLSPSPGDLRWEFWREAVESTHRLWRWELSKLTGASEDRSDTELLARWMRSQPLSERIRGWLSILRRSGWHRSWREWPRWSTLSRRGSPRYCIYATASKLFFELPHLLHAPDRQDVDHLLRWLPEVDNSKEDGPPAWREAARQIALNYQRFLVPTHT